MDCTDALLKMGQVLLLYFVRGLILTGGIDAFADEHDKNNYSGKLILLTVGGIKN